VNMREGNGTVTTTTADGSTVYNAAPGISRFGFSASEVASVTGNLQDTGAQYHTRANQLRESSSQRWSEGLRTLDGTSSGFRTAHGSEGASGAQGGNVETRFDRQGTDTKRQTGSNRTIGDTLSDSKSLGHNQTNTWGLHAGVKAGAGGRLLGGELSGSGSGTWDHAWAKTTGDQETHGSSDSQSETQSANVAHYHANGQDITLTDGGYWRDGAFHRVENFAEKRHAVERDFSEAQALERQASRSDDIGTRIEHIASMSRSNGYQISDDMSQVIASRYATIAASPEFRDLGAPSLTSTTPSPHQREVRNMIVARILEEYAANDLGRVQGALRDPMEEMGAVRGAGPFAVPPEAAQPQTGHPHHSHSGQGPSSSAHHQIDAEQQSHTAPGDRQARDAVDRGAAEVRREDVSVKADFEKNARTAAERDAKTTRDVDQ